MIAFMLDDLRCPPGILLAMLLPTVVIIFNFNILIACRFSDTDKRQAAFFGLVGRILPNDHGIIHHDIQNAHIDNNDPLLHTNHVRRHANTLIPICQKGIP